MGTPLDAASITDKVRRKLGDVGKVELIDAILNDALTDTLRDYSRVKPLRSGLVITLSQSIEYYTLAPAPDFVFDVIPTAPQTAAGRLLGPDFAAAVINLVDFSLPDFDVYYDKISKYRETFEQIEWHYDDPPTIFISPAPLYSVQCLVLGGNVRTIDEVAPIDADIIEAGMCWYALDAWIGQRNAPSVMSAPSSAGTLTLENADRLLPLRDYFKSRFRNKLGWNRPTIVVG